MKIISMQDNKDAGIMAGMSGVAEKCFCESGEGYIATYETNEFSAPVTLIYLNEDEGVKFKID